MSGGRTERTDGKTSIAIVVAAAENGVIGRDGELPWRLSADLAHFKQLTMGHALIMGRKTYESIGRPLPGRLSVVLTRDHAWRSEHPAVLTADSIESAIAAAAGAEGWSAGRVFVIGGGEVYRAVLPVVDHIHLTRVHTELEGDVVFPKIDLSEWSLRDRERHSADNDNEYSYSFELWERVRSP